MKRDGDLYKYNKKNSNYSIKWCGSRWLAIFVWQTYCEITITHNFITIFKHFRETTKAWYHTHSTLKKKNNLMSNLECFTWRITFEYYFVYFRGYINVICQQKLFAYYIIISISPALPLGLWFIQKILILCRWCLWHCLSLSPDAGNHKRTQTSSLKRIIHHSVRDDSSYYYYYYMECGWMRYIRESLWCWLYSHN